MSKFGKLNTAIFGMSVRNCFAFAELHLMLVETLMKAHDNIARDLLMLIGYGSIRSKVYSVRALFYLFPHLIPAGEESYAPAQNDFSSTTIVFDLFSGSN